MLGRERERERGRERKKERDFSERPLVTIRVSERARETGNLPRTPTG